jgi:pyridoxal phosphate enzyme (YggS family)
MSNDMPLTTAEIRQNLEATRARIHAAAQVSGRTADDIRLIAVSKKMPSASVVSAIAAGQHCFGENTLQDTKTRQALIDDPGNEWHFIGHLQTNKARTVAGEFDWLHTLDSLKLASKLCAGTTDRTGALKVLVQVNVAHDPDKHGLQTVSLYRFIDELLRANLSGISLQGLMTIGHRSAMPDQRRTEFATLRELGMQCATRFGTEYFRELSMGMSDDFELAIIEGATMVRVGSAIFGERPPMDARSPHPG